MRLCIEQNIFQVHGDSPFEFLTNPCYNRREQIIHECQIKSAKASLESNAPSCLDDLNQAGREEQKMTKYLADAVRKTRGTVVLG